MTIPEITTVGVLGLASIAALDNATINNLALLGLALLQAWSMWNSKRNRDATKQDISEVKIQTKEIHELVNRPMGVALGASATALEQVAKMSGVEGDIVAASNARRASDLHNAQQATVDAQKLEEDTVKKKIIEDYVASKAPTP